MGKRSCKLTSQLESDSPFIKKTKSDSDVRCDTCRTEFSIGHDGRSDITKHINSDRHKLAVSAAASSKSVENYFRRAQFGEKEAQLAATEAVFAYHTIFHSQSFLSMDCMSRLVQKCFEPKFTCARTKCEAIVVNVLCPFILRQLEEKLRLANFITVFTDASNHKDIKLFPLMVRYFEPLVGVEVKILDIKALPGETADIICSFILDIVQNNNLERKLVGFCADNANTNFGGLQRRGQNNVLVKLQNSLGRRLVGIGCAAHVIHNAMQTAADCLPIDVEAMVFKIYSHFYIYTVRVESLKEFCEFAGVEYQRILGCGKTRWLSLMPAVERILKLFVGLKSYFLSQEKCPTLIRAFFEDPCAELWLYFVHNIAAIFHTTVLRIEEQTVSALEVASALDELVQKCKNRKEQSFLPGEVRMRLRHLEEEGLVQRNEVVKTVVSFYGNCVDYLEQRISQFENVKKFSWVALKEVPSWVAVESSLQLLVSEFPAVKIDDNELFDEVNSVTRYASQEKVSEWNSQHTPVDRIWVEIFLHFNSNSVPFKQVLQIVELVLCLPGTNAPSERVFSVMNNMWTNEKAQLKVETLKAMLVLKCNFDSGDSNFCEKLYNVLSGRPDILKQIHASQKYEVVEAAGPSTGT